MATPADLELSLRRRDIGVYTLDLRFTHPDPANDVDVRLPPGSQPIVTLDFEALRALRLESKAYGDALGAALFADPTVRVAFARARTSADEADVPLRLRLFLDAGAPELHRLRWELLRDPENGALLSTGEHILLSRYLSSFDWRPLRLRPRGAWRALVAIANPRDLDRYSPGGRPLAPVDVAGELARAREALGDIEPTALARPGAATLERIAEQIRDGHDVLYLVCHGALIGNEPRLWLEDAEGMVKVVSGEVLATCLQEARQRPSLVVLASCQSGGDGESGTTDEGALAALGPRLAEIGIPAVVAMQGNVSMKTVASFMPVFFKELRRDGCVDRAMSVARRAIPDREPSEAWAPVLFMRSRSGRVWYVPGFAGDGAAGFKQWPAVLTSIREGHCTPIVGPGVLESLWGSTRDIARRWAETYRFPLAPHDRDDLPQVSQFLAVNQYPQFPHAELEDQLRQAILSRHGADLPPDADALGLDDLVAAVGAVRRERDRAEPHRLLARLPLPLYLTTNPDRLLEDALAAANRPADVALCPWNESIEQRYMNEVQEGTKERPLVYHLFGRLNDRDSLVLTEDNYFDYLFGIARNKDLLPEFVRKAVADSALLFLGFQLNDWGFRVLFRSIYHQEGRSLLRRYAHVAVQIDPEEEQFLEPELARAFLESAFGEDYIRIYWGKAEDFIRDLADRLPPENPPPVAMAGGVGPA
jgi:hypothetical protein